MPRPLPRFPALPGAAFLLAALPSPAARLLEDLLWLWNVSLALFCFGALVWFVYHVFLRRILRARRIANARLARLLSESGEADKTEEITDR